MSSRSSGPCTSVIYLLIVQHIASSVFSPLQVLDVLHQSLPLPLQQLAQLAPDGLHARGTQLRSQGQHLRARLARLIAARGPACSSTRLCLRALQQGGACREGCRGQPVPRTQGSVSSTTNCSQRFSGADTLAEEKVRAKHPPLHLGCSNCKVPAGKQMGCAAPHLTGLWTGETCAGRMTPSLDATAAKLGCPAGPERSISFRVCSKARPACMDAEEPKDLALRL